MSQKLNVHDSGNILCPREIINCFEKPIGIVLDYYNEQYSSYYFVYKKIFQSYKIKEYMYDERNFISKYLGLDYQVLENITDVRDTVINQINKGIPVLISGDVIELYYSNFYKRQSHSHLFLIIGYDDRQLYNILDANPWTQYSGEAYIDQVLELETLNRVYQNSDVKQLIIINKCSTNNTKSDGISVLYLLDLYLNHTYAYPFIEECIIDNINKNISDENYNYNDDLYELVNKPKLKEFLLKELCSLINKELVSEIKDKNILPIIDRYYNSYKKLINKTISQIYRGEIIDKKQFALEIVQYEQAIRREFRNIRNEVVQHNEVNNAFTHKVSDESEKIENNDEHIITKFDSDYYFNFNSNKTYNSWDKDINPKVILMDGLNIYPNFYFETDIDINDDFEEIGFLAGITFYTSNDDIYSWGIHSGASIVLDHMGVNTTLFKVAYHSLNAHIFIELRNYKLFVGYFDLDEKKISKEITINGKISKIAVGCKTWVNGRSLKIKFSKNIFRF